MEIRWLSPEEIEKLVNPDLEARGWAVLNLNESQPTCRVLGAFIDGVLIESFTFQLYQFLGPMIKHLPEMRDSGEMSRCLAVAMHEWLESCGARGYMTVAETPFVERLCERFGMAKVAHPVFEFVRGRRGQ